MKKGISVFIVVLLCGMLWSCGSDKTIEKSLSENSFETTFNPNFDTTLNPNFETKIIKNVTFDMPIYWEEEGSVNECLRYFAEKSGDGVFDVNTASLDISFSVDNDLDYDVSFDGLYADNENMIEHFETSYTDANVLNYEIYESSHGVKGILYEFSFNMSTGLLSEEPAEGFSFCFASEADRRWFFFTMLKAKSADGYDYKDDYMNMIASVSCEAKEEEVTSDVAEVTKTDGILMVADSASYAGKNFKNVEKEFKELGFVNIKLTEKSISETDDPHGTVLSVVADSVDFYKGEFFDKDTLIEVVYLSATTVENEIVLPKEGSKLANDFESKGKTTVYYINIEGEKNVPVLTQWNGVTVTDGVAEYFDYLEELGFTITAENSSHREPYAGYDLYETDFLVSKDDFSWTMFLSIQDELFVEYELDIHLLDN